MPHLPRLTATVLSVLLVSSTALAEEAVKPAPAPGGAAGWVLNGGNVGTGTTVLLAEMGWPGISLTLLHGQSRALDLGGTFGFDYGLEGVPVVAPGLKLNAVVRLGLADSGRYNVGVRVSPGLRTWFPSDTVHYRYFEQFEYRHRDGDVLFGLQFPVELIAGILPTPSLSVNVALSLPMALYLVPEVSFVFPIQPGLGLEYRVVSAVSATGGARVGGRGRGGLGVSTREHVAFSGPPQEVFPVRRPRATNWVMHPRSSWLRFLGVVGVALVLSVGGAVLVDMGASSVGLFSLGARSKIARTLGRCGAQDMAADLRSASLCLGKRFTWNGGACVELLCPCQGADCGDIFPSQEDCEAAFAHCRPGR